MTEVSKVWITDKAVYVRLVDGREGSELIADYPRLRDASPEALKDYEIDAVGIHWPRLDEDLAFDGFFRERREKCPLYKLFLSFPEINVSAVARRLGISQSLMAQYVSGMKKPSKEREEAIVNELRALGAALSEASV